MPKTFQHEVFIPFYWGDAAGILFYGHVFSIAHQALENFIIHELGLAWQDWFQNEEWIVPIKQTEAKYDSPIQLGKICLVRLEIEEVRTSSFSVSYHLIQDNVECCQVNTLHVFCNKKTKQKQPIPEKINAMLK
jgi:acyl-CoA thioesterase FadM